MGSSAPMVNETADEIAALVDCVAQTQSGDGCVDQASFILSKSRVMAQYDIQNITGGSTRVVFTLPTKHNSCALNGQGTDFNGVAVPPFSCQGANGALGGEQIGRPCGAR